jgi:hypothetical protein
MRNIPQKKKEKNNRDSNIEDGTWLSITFIIWLKYFPE